MLCDDVPPLQNGHLASLKARRRHSMTNDLWIGEAADMQVFMTDKQHSMHRY